jgi:hypothetical protein
VPPAPTGQVTVVGQVHLSESRPTPIEHRDGRLDTRRISVPRLAEQMPFPVYGAYILVTGQTPANDPAFSEIPIDHEDDWQNAGYTVQWWLFACMALYAYVYYARKEVQLRAGVPPKKAASLPPTGDRVEEADRRRAEEHADGRPAENADSRPAEEQAGGRLAENADSRRAEEHANGRPAENADSRRPEEQAGGRLVVKADSKRADVVQADSKRAEKEAAERKRAEKAERKRADKEAAERKRAEKVERIRAEAVRKAPVDRVEEADRKRAEAEAKRRLAAQSGQD